MYRIKVVNKYSKEALFIKSITKKSGVLTKEPDRAKTWSRMHDAFVARDKLFAEPRIINNYNICVELCLPGFPVCEIEEEII